MAFCRGLCERALPPGRLRLLSTRIVAIGLLPRVRPWDRTVELTTPPSWPPTTAIAPQMPPNATNQSFPTLLVVTTSVLVEAGLAHQAYLAQQRYGHAAVFLSDDAGSYPCPPRDGSGSYLALSGAIWRGPGPGLQLDRLAWVAWLPGRPGRPSAKAGE